MLHVLGKNGELLRAQNKKKHKNYIGIEVIVIRNPLNRQLPDACLYSQHKDFG